MTTNLHDLALRTAGALDLTDDAAEGALREYIAQTQVLEDRTIDPDEISDEDATFLMEACRQGQRAGDMGRAELVSLEEAATRLRTAEEDVEIAREARDRAIGTALKAGVRQKDVAEVAGISRSRLYKITTQM